MASSTTSNADPGDSTPSIGAILLEEGVNSSQLANAANAVAESNGNLTLLEPEQEPLSRWNPFLLKEDYRGLIPRQLSRFVGYHPPDDAALKHQPLPFSPFSWISRLRLRYEVWFYATIGAFTAMLLIEATMTTSTTFRNAYHAPSIVGSFGASAVLVFAVTESPLAQPRNVVLGQTISAIVSVAITKLWCLTNPDYSSNLDNKEFYAPGFVNGALCMSLGMLVQLFLGITHPPGGATALAGASDPVIVAMSWHYVPVVLVSSLIMTGTGLLMNNLGRRRYPVYWWAPGRTFVRAPQPVKQPNDIEAKPTRQDS